jgi:hypothetical protein
MARVSMKVKKRTNPLKRKIAKGRLARAAKVAMVGKAIGRKGAKKRSRTKK